jgi:hypothetical protein
MRLHSKSALVLGLCAGLAVPAIAQQSPPTPPQDPLQSPLPCEDFRKNEDMDWVAKQDMTVPGPTGPVQIKTGMVVNDDLQIELDDRCK